jgi:hypothetical protein
MTKKEKRTPTIAHLPAFLEMSEEQLANSKRIQEEARQAMFGRVQANQAEARLISGIHTERAARDNLTVLQNHKRHKGRAARVKAQLARLADAYAAQGRYDEAAATHPRKTTAKEYAEIAAAIERPDTDVCDCPPDEVRDPASGQTLKIPARNHIADVYNAKLGQMVPLIECRKCPPGHRLNARPLRPTGELAARLRARAGTRAVVLTREELERRAKAPTDLALLR